MESHYYKALARKYRPQLFSDLIGQDVLVRIITNAINHSKIPHAMLLTGIRGVGKTTTARIIARALNCIGPSGDLNIPSKEPCGVCNNCVAISESRHPDVVEMDAASNTSVNDVRAIIENVAYKPISARDKIYIIDEVHMLSSSAFNALLKTLEEPPAHTKFIFATTEMDKIPLTILSRCQKFYLKRISVEHLVKHYEEIALKEGVSIDKEAVYMVAKAADGSVRDGLSILDQAIALSSCTNVTKEIVEEMLGLGGLDAVYELFDSVIRGDVVVALSFASSLYERGVDPVHIIRALLELVHDITLSKTNGKICERSNSETHKRYMESFARSLDIIFLSRIWQMLMKGMEEISISMLPFESLEMVIIRIAYANTLETPEDILNGLKTSSSQQNQQRSLEQNMKRNDRDFDSACSTQSAVVEYKNNAQDVDILSDNSAKYASFDPTNANDLISILYDHNEMVLCYALQNEISVNSITEHVIRVTLLNGANNNIASLLEKKICDITKQKWRVEIESDDFARSLTELENLQNEKMRSNVIQSSLVQHILQKFPGSKVSHIEFK
ncbi:DNA polymerase III subunit gamma/tau [Candidatus Lariskella endosymbiont of Epinotia ramella]|uniref:DNA polymerase III subunit gamma/tau n=1 Tax=Candidatus Lariskella endosymbiont of Epinotia ramella TaxID=3066224 RepID=UPI0030D3961D